MKKYNVEYKRSYSPNSESDNYIGDYVEANSLDEALDFAKDWCLENGVSEEEFAELIPVVIDFETHERYDLDMRYLVVCETMLGDTISTDVYDTLNEANVAAVRDWDRLSPTERKHRKIYVLDVAAEDCNTDDDGVDWCGWISGGSEEDRFDSSEASVTVKKFPANIEIWIKGSHVNISTDGLSIANELDENPDADEKAVIDGWIEADFEYIESVMQRKLFFNEKEEIKTELENIYSFK